MDDFRLGILSSLKKNNMKDQAVDFIGFFHQDQ